MTRIAGVFTRHGADETGFIFSRVSAAMGERGSTAHEHVLGAASFCWSGSESPIVAVKDGVMAIADGHFYNLDELDVPPGQSISERLISLYRRYGFPKALTRINGDFAIALFDQRTNILWLGRDRVGHRPLYYVNTEDAFVFCSQPRPLLVVPGISTEVNRRWVAVFAGSHYRYIDNESEESPFSAVRQLPAASVLEVSGQIHRQTHYWKLEPQTEFAEDEQTLALRYRDLLVDSVKRRLRASKRPAFTLSGGMDSSSVLACAVELTGEKQDAFSSVYSDLTYDESADIKGFVREKVARWKPVLIEGFDLFNTVREMVRAHDEPVATATWLSHFLLCREVSASNVSTLFGGLGGDELNAGEYEYFIFHFADLKRGGDNERLMHEIREWSFHHDHPIYRKSVETAERMLNRLTDSSAPGRVRVERDRMARYARTVSRDYFDLETFEPLHDHLFTSYLKNRTYQDIFRETAPCCLRAEDRNCTAWDLDHMDPFFDYRLMEFMFRVPGSMKIRDGITKRLLREAMKGILPEDTRTRVKKTGWNAPAHVWFSGKGMEHVLDLVHSRKFRERGVYDVSEVMRLINEHRLIVEKNLVRENHMMFIWQLVNIELWFQEIVDRQSTTTLAA